MDVDGGLVVEATINKVGGSVEVFVSLKILTGVEEVVDVTKVWVLKNFNLKGKKVKALVGKEMRVWEFNNESKVRN